MNSKKIIKRISEHIALEGFKPAVVNYLLMLARVTENRRDEIVFPTTKRTMASNLVARIQFPAVEEIYKSAVNKNDGNYVSSTLLKQVDADSFVNTYEIIYTEDVDKDIPYFKEAIDNGAIPFFNKYQSVEAVYGEMKNINKSNYLDYMQGLHKFIGHPVIVRYLIILGLMGDDDFYKESDRQLKFIEEHESSNAEIDLQTRNVNKILPTVIQMTKEKFGSLK